MKDARETTMKNGRPATQGVCPVCGTKIQRIAKARAPKWYRRFFNGLFSPVLRENRPSALSRSHV
jgi:hypothetical protein